MRFWTRNLFLFAVIFIPTTYLISAFALPPLRTYRYQHEVNRIRHVHDWVETSLRHCSYHQLTVTDETLTQWLAHDLPANHPASEFLDDPPRMDAWGNPYRVQPRGSLMTAVRVYSTGHDGESLADGNDPDDIRSWDPNRGAWYSKWQYRKELAFCMILAGIATAFIFWGLNSAGSRRQTTPGVGG